VVDMPIPDAPPTDGFSAGGDFLPGSSAIDPPV
jgi:hypothetical protein